MTSFEEEEKSRGRKKILHKKEKEKRKQNIFPKGFYFSVPTFFFVPNCVST